MIFTFISRITAAFFGGLLTALVCMQYDPFVQKECAELFRRAFSDVFDCTMAFESMRVHFISPRIEFERVEVRSNDQGAYTWSWTCDRYITKFSWLDVFREGVLGLHVTLERHAVQSTCVDGDIAVRPHMEKIITDPGLFVPICLRTLRITDGSMNVYAQFGSAQASVRYEGTFKRTRRKTHILLHVHDGSLFACNRLWGHTIRGRLSCGIRAGKSPVLEEARCELSVLFPELCTPELCFVSGVWNQDHGRIRVRNVDQSFFIDPVSVTLHNGVCNVRAVCGCPLQTVGVLAGSSAYTHVTGSLLASIRGQVSPHGSCEGVITCSDASWWGIPCVGKTAFKKQGDVFSGDCCVRIPPYVQCTGAWTWDLGKGVVDASLANDGIITHDRFSYWRINPGNVAFRLLSNGRTTKVRHAWRIYNTLIDKVLQTKGTASVCDGVVQIQGSVNTATYTGTCDTTQRALRIEGSIHRFDGRPCLEVVPATDASNILEIRLPIQALKDFTTFMCGYPVQGDGALVAHVSSRGGNPSMRLYLDQGVIRIPGTYNFVNSFETDIFYDVDKRQLVMRDMAASLHTGFLWSDRATAYLSPSGFIESMHVPLLFEHCLVSLKRDFFAAASGALTISMQKGAQPKLSGFMTIDRSQLRENIFSQEFQRRALYAADTTTVAGKAMPIQLDVQINTRNCVRIETPLLETSARASVSLTGTTVDPRLSGTVSLVGGTLSLPYKPLHIVDGTLTFDPSRTQDPLISFTACNTIKNHHVQVHIGGSMRDYHVILESSPPLTQEQVASLLLVGSHDEHLNVMAPALLVQNVANFIIGAHRSSQFDQWSRKRSLPLRVALVPSFTDQTGRGGLRAGLELAYGDRWRALIQKNFSLSEDTRFELEYMALEDVSVRAIRNERRDLGAEVEMRWKL